MFRFSRCKRDALPTELSARTGETRAFQPFSRPVKQRFGERSGNSGSLGEQQVPTHPRSGAAKINYGQVRRAARVAARVSGEHAAHHYLRMIAGREIVPERRRATEPGFVYFVGGDEGPVKIGFARNVDARVADLQTGSPVKLRPLASVPGPPTDERDYHRRFAAHRLHGEWFERHPDILAEIERLSLPQPAIPGLKG